MTLRKPKRPKPKKPKRKVGRPSTRCYRDPIYRTWRKEVRARDGCCQYPHCGSTKSTQVHHVKKWSSNPMLRYNVDNGILLCKKHHRAITGKEEHYERLFRQIIYSKKRNA